MLWLKQFRRKKIQSALIFVIIALCSVLIAGSTIILTSLTSPYQEMRIETKSPDLKIYPGDFSKNTKNFTEFVGSIEGVQKTDKIEKHTINALLFNNEKIEVFADICKYNDVYKSVRVIEGNMSDISENKCAMPTALAYQNKISIGDTIRIPLGDAEKEYTVVAIYADIFSLSTAFTSDILVSDISPELETDDVIAVYFNDDYTFSQFVKDYTNKNNGIMDGYFRSVDDNITNSALTEKILGGILLGISSCILLVILLIINYIVKNAIRKDKKNIAVYKSIGYTDKKISNIYITFYQSIVFFASVIGSLCSGILSSAFMKTAYKNIGVTNVSSDLWQKAVCIIFVNIVTFIILYIEFSKLKKLKPVAILSGNENSMGIKKQKRSKKSLQNFSPLSIALRTFLYEKKRTALIVITCIVSFYIVNISVVCLQNIDLIAGETNYYWLGIDKHDITLENLGSYEKFTDIYNELKNDSDVKSVTFKDYDADFAIPYKETVSGIVAENYTDIEFDVTDGRNPLNSDEITVGNLYLKKSNLSIGDYMEIYLTPTLKKKMLIVGSFQGFFNLGNCVRVTGSLYEENNIPFKYGKIAVNLNENVDKDKFVEDCNEKYGTYVNVTKRQDMFSSIMSMICDPQKDSILPLVIITIVIALTNLFYIIYSTNCDNRKKYAIMKSIGYAPIHIVKTNMIYVGIIALVSIIVAIPLLVFVFPKIMLIAMSGFGFVEYKLTIKAFTLVWLNAGMFVLFMLMTFVSCFDLYKNHLNYIINE